MSNKDVVTNEYSLLFGDCLERMKEIPDGSVELVQVDYGFKSLAVIWVKDKDRGVTLKQEIICDDWSEEDVLKKKIGQKYKVFEVGKDVRPTYYKLSESFC